MNGGDLVMNPAPTSTYVPVCNPSNPSQVILVNPNTIIWGDVDSGAIESALGALYGSPIVWAGLTAYGIYKLMAYGASFLDGSNQAACQPVHGEVSTSWQWWWDGVAYQGADPVMPDNMGSADMSIYPDDPVFSDGFDAEVTYYTDSNNGYYDEYGNWWAT